VAVASAGPYASLHLAPDRQPHQQPTTLFFTGWMPFLLTNEQRQSTEGNNLLLHHYEQKIFNNSGSTAMMPEDHRATTMHSAYIHHTIYRETSNQRLDNDNH